jgi:hypothetical protein
MKSKQVPAMARHIAKSIEKSDSRGKEEVKKESYIVASRKQIR